MEFNSESFSAFLAIALATKKLEKDKYGKEKFYFSCHFGSAKVTFTCEADKEVSIRFKGFSKIGGYDRVGEDPLDDNAFKDVLEDIKDNDNDVSDGVLGKLTLDSNHVALFKNDEKKEKEEIKIEGTQFIDSNYLKDSFIGKDDITKNLTFVLDEKLSISKFFDTFSGIKDVSFEGNEEVICSKKKEPEKEIKDAVEKFNEEYGQKGKDENKKILQKMSRYVRIRAIDQGEGKEIKIDSIDFTKVPGKLDEDDEKLIRSAINNAVKSLTRNQASLDVNEVKFKVKWEEAEETDSAVSGQDSSGVKEILNDNNFLYKMFEKVKSKVKFKGNKVAILAGFNDIFDEDEEFVKLFNEKGLDKRLKGYIRLQFKRRMKNDLLQSKGKKVFGHNIERNERETLHDFLRIIKNEKELIDNEEYKFMKSVILDNPEIMDEVEKKVIKKDRMDAKGVKDIKEIIRGALEGKLKEEKISIRRIKARIKDGEKMIKDGDFYDENDRDKAERVVKKSVEGLKKIPNGFFIDI